MATPIHLYICENLTFNTAGKRRTETSDMKFLGKAASYITRLNKELHYLKWAKNIQYRKEYCRVRKELACTAYTNENTQWAVR
jgi:hypothetical protein